MAEVDTYWRDDVIPVLGDGIGWYSILGFEPIQTSGENYRTDSDFTPQELVTLLKDQISSFGVERTLTYLRLHSIIGEHLVDLSYTSRDEAGLTAQLARFGFGLAMSVEPGTQSFHDDNAETPIISKFPEEYREFVHLLRRTIDVFGGDDFLRSETEIDPDSEDRYRLEVARAVQNRELIVSRMAFHRQYLHAMERQYTPFQTELFDNFGLDIIDSVRWSKNIVNEQERRLAALLQRATEYRNSCLRVLGGYYRAKEVDGWIETPEEYAETDQFRQLRRRELVNLNDVVTEIRNKLWLREGELRRIAEADDSVSFEAYLNHIQTEVGHPSLSSPYEHNPIDEAPLVKVGEYSFLPPLPRLCYALSQRFYYLLLDKKSQFTIDFGNIWGKIIEIWALNRIGRLFSDHEFSHSIEYESSNGPGEIDILIRFDDYLLVCEVKSKRLSVEARTGSLKRISSDTLDPESGIGEAISQVTQSINALKNIGTSTTIRDEIPFELDPSEINHYEPIIITATHYDQLATRELPKILQGYADEDLPYVCSVYDLDAFAEVLTGLEFVDYVDARREEFTKRQAFGSGDELDFLDAYKAGVLRQSSLPIPSKEEADAKGIEIIRRISSIDAGVHQQVAGRYGLVTKFDPTAF